MKYAINLADLTKFVQHPFKHPAHMLIRSFLTDQIVECEGPSRVDTDSILVDNSDEIRWQAVIKLIREGAGNLAPLKKYELRIYEAADGSKQWKRI